MSDQAAAFDATDVWSCFSAGSSSSLIASTAAMWIAVGKTSLEDCERLTWSFGWIGLFPPRVPVAASFAREAITSLTFMLLCVPEPVCQTESGNSLTRFPERISSAAFTISAALSFGRRPSSAFVSAAARFTRARALMMRRGISSSPMSKNCSDRAVCAPQWCSLGTSIGPNESCSLRIPAPFASLIPASESRRLRPVPLSVGSWRWMR